MRPSIVVPSSMCPCVLWNHKQPVWVPAWPFLRNAERPQQAIYADRCHLQI